MDKKKNKKVWLIVSLTICALIIALFIAGITVAFVDYSSPVGTFLRDYIFDVEGMKDAFSDGGQLKIIVNSIFYIVLIFAISKILRIIFKSKINKTDRAKTIVSLLDGLVKYGSAIAIIIFALKACGVDTGALLASVGVLTLIVGLGAQTLIADVIAGMFIIFENEYNTGEIISIDGFRGKVIEIGIRTTKLLDAAGNIKIVNHSNISNVVNLSRELSLAVVDCDFPYDVPIEHIEKLFEKKFDGMKEKIPGIVEGPFYKGVSEYKDSNVTVRIVASCNEDDRYQVQRDLLREYRAIITEEGIDISYPHVVIDQPTKTEIKVTKRDKKIAENFVDEQKELSAELDDQQEN